MWSSIKNMWHPFKKVRLEPVKISSDESSQLNINPVLNKEIEKAQLRSLKARTEITMIYDRLSEGAVSKLKGGPKYVSFP